MAKKYTNKKITTFVQYYSLFQVCKKPDNNDYLSDIYLVILYSFGAEAVENILHRTPASIITPEVTDIIAEVIKEELGPQALIPPITTAFGEDFFWYPKEKPELKTGFIALGEDAQPGLHDPNMHFDHSALPNGVKLHVGLVKKILG